MSEPLDSTTHDQRRGREDDEVDLFGLVRAVRHRWWWLFVGGLLGLGAAMLVVWLVPARFDGHARVLIRTSADPTAGIRSKLGPIAELAPNALGGGKAEELDTELEILSSRSVIGVIVDSLRLQVRPIEPPRVPPRAIVDSIALPGRFKPRVVSLTEGANQLPEGKVWVHAGVKTPLRVRIFDREETIDLADESFEIKQRAGDVVGIDFRGFDSVTVADAPNLLVETYLARRKTVDRGLNQRRLEFLMAAVDSVQDDLRNSGRKLRTSQEKEGVLDPELSGKAIIEQFGLLEGTVSTLRAEEQSLDTVLSNAGSRNFDARRLAGFPALLKSPAVNDLVSQLSKLQVDRAAQAGRLTSDAPEVRAIDIASDSLTRQLLPLAQTYRESLRRQREALASDVARLRSRLEALPRQAEALQSGRTDVERLTRLDLGMGSQVLEARLAAITEGGDVRLLDPAVSPRKVAFPRPLMTMALGIMAGGVLAAMLVLLVGAPAATRRVN